jgi:transcriptional regulator GlxA family with amidase domain
MEAHGEEPIQLRDIAGRRHRQHAFARHYDASPMSHLRQVRFEQAHHDSQVADPAAGDTVAASARRWGFAKPSHSARNHLDATDSFPATLSGMTRRGGAEDR